MSGAISSGMAYKEIETAANADPQPFGERHAGQRQGKGEEHVARDQIASGDHPFGGAWFDRLFLFRLSGASAAKHNGPGAS